MLASVERNESSNHMKQMEDVHKFLLVDWSVDFAMDDEFDNERSIKWIGKSHFSLNLGSKKYPYVECVHFAFVNVLYNVYELVDLAWVEIPFAFRFEWRPNGGGMT